MENEETQLEKQRRRKRIVDHLVGEGIMANGNAPIAYALIELHIAEYFTRDPIAREGAYGHMKRIVAVARRKMGEGGSSAGTLRIMDKRTEMVGRSLGVSEVLA